MPVFWLDDQSLEFPAPELATPEGILAVGGDLSPARLLEAYAGVSFLGSMKETLFCGGLRTLALFCSLMN